jgi:two-component system chemotaxis response regulator CheB
MVNRDVVVVGGSTGAVESLQILARGLRPDLQASVLVVLHTMPGWPTRMPELLENCGPLPAGHAVDGEPLHRGRIYFAPPGRHMIVDGETLRTLHGPKESWSRPSIDTLFRSCAVSLGPRVIGIVLRGRRYDGAAGAEAIKRCGGRIVVQSVEGPTAELPMGVRDLTEVDAVLPIEQIPGRIANWVKETAPDRAEFPVPATIRLENELMLGHTDSIEALASLDAIGKLTVLTCPQCHGSLWKIDDPALLRYRCHVGHSFSAEELDEEQKETIEGALWSAARELEERVVSTRGLAELARRRHEAGQARVFEERSRLAGEHVKLLTRLAAELTRGLRPDGAG